MTYLKKAISLWYIYLTLNPKVIKIKIYQYKHQFIIIVLIYFNLFRKVFLTTIYVLQVESLLAAREFFSSWAGRTLFDHIIFYPFVVGYVSDQASVCSLKWDVVVMNEVFKGGVF